MTPESTACASCDEGSSAQLLDIIGNVTNYLPIGHQVAVFRAKFRQLAELARAPFLYPGERKIIRDLAEKNALQLLLLQEKVRLEVLTSGSWDREVSLKLDAIEVLLMAENG